MNTPNKRRLFYTLYFLGVFITVLIVYLGISYGIKYLAQRNLYQKTTIISDSFLKGLLSQVGATYSTQAVFNDNPPSSEQAWQNVAYAQALFGRYSGLQTLYYIELVPDSEKSKYLKKISTDPLLIKGPNFGINPPGTMPVYAPVTYSVGPDSNYQPVLYSGANLYTDLNRKETLDQAAKSRSATMTPPLPGIDHKDLIFFITLPLYYQNEVNFGFANSVFQIDKLIDKLIGDQLTNAHIELKIEDITDGSKRFAYQSLGFDGVKNPVYATSEIQMLNRKWLMTYKSSVNQQTPPITVVIPFVMAGMTLILLLQPQIYRYVKRRSLKPGPAHQKPTQPTSRNKSHRS